MILRNCTNKCCIKTILKSSLNPPQCSACSGVSISILLPRIAVILCRVDSPLKQIMIPTLDLDDYYFHQYVCISNIWNDNVTMAICYFEKSFIMKMLFPPWGSGNTNSVTNPPAHPCGIMVKLKSHRTSLK